MNKSSVTAILVLISLSLTACDKLGTFDIKWTPPVALPEARDQAVDASPIDQ